MVARVLFLRSLHCLIGSHLDVKFTSSSVFENDKKIRNACVFIGFPADREVGSAQQISSRTLEDTVFDQPISDQDFLTNQH